MMRNNKQEKKNRRGTDAIDRSARCVLERLENRALFTASVDSFTLINADTEQEIMTIPNGGVINLAEMPTRNFNIRANVSGDPAADVEFDLDGQASIDAAAPYALLGDTAGDYPAVDLTPGAHSLSAVATDTTDVVGDPLEVDFTVIEKTPAPENFTGYGISMSQIKLTWNDVSNNEVHFIIDRSVDGVTYQRLASLPAGSTSFVDSGLPRNTRFWYRIKAIAPVENSRWAVTAPKTLSKPGAPANLTATGISTTQVKLNWTDTSIEESHFLVERSLDGVTYVRIASLPTNTQTFTDNGLKASTKYYYRVKSCTKLHTSPWVYTAGTTQATVTPTPTPEPTPEPTPTPTPTFSVASFTLINADTDLAIMTLSNGATIDLSALPTRNLNVRANVSGAVGSVQFLYDGSVYRTESGAPYALAGDSGGNFNAWTPALGTHTLKGVAWSLSGATGTSGGSTTASFNVTEGNPVAPVAPTHLTATASSSSRINLAWTDQSTNESGFKIERSTDGVNFTQIATVGVNVKSYASTGLTAETQYTYRVRAYNTVGDSGYSNNASATTTAVVVDPTPTPTPTPGDFPTASNTGPTNRDILVVRGSMNITQEGAVVENFHIKGGTVTISANNVTLRNFIIENPISTGAAIKFANNDVKGGLIENGEIFGGTATNGVSGSFFTARRLHIYNMQSDCFRVKNQATIEYCYMHDFGLSPNSHGDGVQMYPTDGSGHIIRFNYIDARNANAALFQVDNGWHIEGNYLRGGNYTIYCEGIPENKFINNTWGRDYKYGPIYTGRGDKSLLTWSGNKWDNGTAFNVT